jgi:hypothetical protein
MSELLSDLFISKAKIVHNNKYNYSDVKYISNKTPVYIICNIHGTFKQIPSNHLKGHGCAKCSLNMKMNTENFIYKSIIVHKNKYDYSLVNYTNAHTKVKIVCSIHGVFEQKPDNHLRGNGCPICGGKKKLSLENFINRSKNTHGNKFDYSETVYINTNTKVGIICMIHGKFEKFPMDHINGSGCPSCSNKRKKNNSDFVFYATNIHNNKYVYEKINYVNNYTKLEIICPKHGVFWQTPLAHLRGQECPKCRGNCISKLEIKWLDSLEIPQHFRHKSIIMDNKKYMVDAYDPNTNTIYEFYGDFWHGNPQIYKYDEINIRNKKTFGFLYQKTIEREKIFINNNYKLITMWESDFKI